MNRKSRPVHPPPAIALTQKTVCQWNGVARSGAADTVSLRRAPVAPSAITRAASGGLPGRGRRTSKASASGGTGKE